MKKKFWAAALIATMLSPASYAAPRPVNLGLGGNWELHLTRSTNVGWARIDFSWSATEPQQNVWNWAEAETHVTEAEQNGLKILAVLHYVPAWANGGGNQATPPMNTVDWADFVRALASRYPNRIHAYEIWNEPDTSGDGGGIGWNRNVEEPPLYTDFVHAAAQQIRLYSPQSIVIGPAYRSRNDGSNSQADNRKRRFFQQMSQTWYVDGHGPSFLDATSYHNNAGDTESSKDMGRRLFVENLSYLTNYLPTRKTAPVWVTEYGWRSNATGDAGQREKECNLTKIYTGFLEPAYTGLGAYNITHSFIYTQQDNSSRSVFYNAFQPKLVVTQYLQRFAFPAVQQPNSFPNCNGSLTLLETPTRVKIAQEKWAARGLQNPKLALPAGFTELDAESTSDSVNIVYQGTGGELISVSARPAEVDDENFVSDSVAEWTQGNTHFRVSPIGEAELEKGWARKVAASIDSNFANACVEDRLLATNATVESLGFRAPKAPRGFVAHQDRLDLVRTTGACAAANASRPKDIDFFWSFVGANGEIVKAGIYRFGEGFNGNVIKERSLHWSDGHGTRYWVATDETELTPALKEALYALADSMDPVFARKHIQREHRGGRIQQQ